ncbi:hypothetical protein PL10110_330019 [Planktothrix agardhii]|nr:hypothetical protein PL10110_330019 [Planktothrix agardhii]
MVGAIHELPLPQGLNFKKYYNLNRIAIEANDISTISKNQEDDP